MKNCIIYCTVPNEFNANLIATTLVEENLAACVNILPAVTSVYRWNDKAQEDKELLLMIKTPGLFSAIGFDSGGVATGPMSSAFLLPLAMGAASGSTASSLSASFGMIAMIAMMPILLIEILGIIYQTRVNKAERGEK